MKLLVQSLLPDDNVWAAMELAPRIRESQVREIIDLHEDDVEMALRDTIRTSRYSAIVWLDGAPAAAFGYNHLTPGQGSVWLAVTEIIDEYPLTFLRCCKRHLAQMLLYCPVLVATVSLHNRQAIEMLEWLGFKVGQRPHIASSGEPYVFARRTDAPDEEGPEDHGCDGRQVRQEEGSVGVLRVS